MESTEDLVECVLLEAICRSLGIGIGLEVSRDVFSLLGRSDPSVSVSPEAEVTLHSCLIRTRSSKFPRQETFKTHFRPIQCVWRDTC